MFKRSMRAASEVKRVFRHAGREDLGWVLCAAAFVAVLYPMVRVMAAYDWAKERLDQ